MLDILLEDFFLNGVFALLIASFVTAPLGSIILWNKLSYMGDSIAHSSLLGVGIAIMLQVNISLSALLVAFSLAIVLSFVIDKTHSTDAILNIMTSVVMSMGMVLLSFLPSSGERIIHSLFGDVLMVSYRDLVEMFVISLVGSLIFLCRWKYWIAVSISHDLSLSAGLKARRIKMEILLATAVVVVLFSRVVGILLITAFLIIPASGARVLARTPAQMVMISVVISATSGILGLLFSVKFDTFPGPVTIIVSFIFMLLAHFLKR